MSKLKRLLFNWMEAYLCKHDQGRIKASINIPTTTIDFDKYIPKDGKWHFAEIYISAYLKRDNNAMSEVVINIDSKTVYRYDLKEASGQVTSTTPLEKEQGK